MQICVQCQTAFEVTQKDLAFYDAVSPVFGGKKFPVPPPSHCPDCRAQRRMNWRNERNLYRRVCDLCKKSIVSVYPEKSPFPVYCNRCWWSDAWDPLSHGIAADPDKDFLGQWTALRDRVPQLAIQNDNTAGSENCEYCYDFAFGKNCYLANCTWHVEEIYYSTGCNYTRYMVDCHMALNQCELCYECVDSEKLYGCAYLQDSEGCTDCAFGQDLKGCKSCFCCFGLRHKEHYIFNEQVTSEEYERRISAWKTGSHTERERVRKEFEAWILPFPRPYARMRQCEDCVGNNVFYSKNTTGFNVYSSEECKFLEWTHNLKNCYDVLSSGKPQWCLDCVTPDSSFRVLFSNWCWVCSDILYSDNCHNCEHLIGCTGLRHKKHCIFNVQYTPEEYEALAVRIMDSLVATPLWGNLFPLSVSPFAYNESLAQDHYPLTEDQAKEHGWRWSHNLPFTTGKETLSADTIPDAIADVPDTIVGEVLACAACHRNYKIIAPELALYRQMKLPVPRHCPECRHRGRLARHMPSRLWDRQCAKCKKKIRTAYSPDRPEIVYCEECYLETVY